MGVGRCSSECSGSGGKGRAHSMLAIAHLSPSTAGKNRADTQDATCKKSIAPGWAFNGWWPVPLLRSDRPPDVPSMGPLLQSFIIIGELSCCMCRCAGGVSLASRVTHWMRRPRRPDWPALVTPAADGRRRPACLLVRKGQPASHPQGFAGRIDSSFLSCTPSLSTKKSRRGRRPWRGRGRGRG